MSWLRAWWQLLVPPTVEEPTPRQGLEPAGDGVLQLDELHDGSSPK